jgi:hypothetical protein
MSTMATMSSGVFLKSHHAKHIIDIVDIVLFMSHQKISFTPVQAQKLMEEIAAVAEASYRRGAQHAVAVNLSAEDAAWYRSFTAGCTTFKWATALPSDGRRWTAKEFKCVERMEWGSWVSERALSGLCTILCRAIQKQNRDKGFSARSRSALA